MGSLRRARLQRQFGPEYDRLVKARGKKKAEAELTERQRRVESLEIHELTPQQQASYSGDWAAIQERFVDTPAEAVSAAHTLIGSVMRDRGYPVVAVPFADWLGARATLKPFAEADHSFHVPKRSGRTDREILGELADAVAAWIDAAIRP